MRAAAVLAASLAAPLGCSGPRPSPVGGVADDAGIDGAASSQSEPDSAPGDGVIPTYAPTYSAVWSEILLHNCALEFCHAGSADYLHLYSEEIGYEALVGAPAQGPLCAPTGLLRVDPFHPETSLMYLKVTNPPCGSRMPINYAGGVPLDSRQVAQIRQWIACGALDGDAGCPAEAGPDASGPDATSSDAPTD